MSAGFEELKYANTSFKSIEQSFVWVQQVDFKPVNFIDLFGQIRFCQRLKNLLLMAIKKTHHSSTYHLWKLTIKATTAAG